MEKSRDLKIREATRLKRSSKTKRSSSGLVKSEKKIKNLSSVVEMGSFGTSRDEDGFHSFSGNDSNGKRFSLSDKCFDDYNDIGHASVPRRLRSAMKKRGHDSLSPPLPFSKKAKTHMKDVTNSTKMEVGKKSKSNMKQGKSERRSKKRILSGTITKDEEEVAATLFELAGLFADSNSNNKSEQSHGSSNPIPSDVPESNDNHPITVVEDSQKQSKPAEAVVALSNTKKRLPETVKVEPSNEQKLHLQSDDSVPRVTLHSSMAKIEAQCDLKPLIGSVKFCVQSELNSDARLGHTQQQKTSFLETKPETKGGIDTHIESQAEPEDSNRNVVKGLALWPGLPLTTVSKTAQSEEPLLPSPASKLPGWLDTACSGSRSNSIQIDSFAQVFKVTADRLPSKRCATHVYISHLIQTLKASKSEDRMPVPQSQIRTHEQPNQGVSSTINGVGIGINEVLSVSAINSANANQRASDSKNCALDQRTYDHSQPDSSKWHKQSFDLFMSLARGGGMEVTDSSRNGVGSLSQFQNLYLPSYSQNQFNPSYSIPQHHFASAHQVQMQIPSYTSPYYGTQPSSAVLTKQHHLHQQQRNQQEAQRRLWVGQYRSDETTKQTIQFLNLQNGSTPQQPPQQHSMNYGPSSPLSYSGGKVSGQDRHVPYNYEEHGGGFRTSSLVSLQLLCNEQR